MSKRRHGGVLVLLVLFFIILTLVFLAIRYRQRKPMQDLFGVTIPVTYRDSLSKYAEHYSVDPFLLAAIAHTESSFRADVISSAGAVGLMQIMPESEEWLLPLAGIEKQDLSDPDYSIQLGACLLDYLLTHYQQNVVSATAAYNAGPGNVDFWLTKAKYSHDGINLIPEAIPFAETRQYVERVLRTRDALQQAYGGVFPSDQEP
ncbi:MAG: lytic transglycosylase domain-containing protein [Eubacteriales bacterium]|nr:lytic transglycosylase domain-containing protein [Eubacteriales bacterium]